MRAASILLAASPEPSAILQRVLAGHGLRCAHTLADAEQSLHQDSWDMVVCTVLFDESRMFEMLRLAKARPVWRDIPFVCVRVRGHVMDVPVAIEAVAFTCRALGAAAFLNAADYRVDPDRELREAIERLLPAGA